MDIKKFTDYDQIPVDHRLAVEKCIRNDLIHGKEDGSYFDPSGTITLAEVCKILVYSLNHDHAKKPVLNFTAPRDSLSLERGHWAEAYIQYCRSLKIYPYNARSTSPERFLTVRDANLIVSRLYKFFKEYYHVEYCADFPAPSLMNDMPDRKVTRSEICLILVNAYCCFWYSALCVCISSNDKSHTILDLISALMDKSEVFPFLSEDTRYFVTCLITQGPSENIPLEHLLAVFELQHLKELHFCKNLPDSVFHFTSITVLSCLSKAGSKLRLSNSAFLNDPSEGLVIRKYFEEYTTGPRANSLCSTLIKGYLNTDSDAIPISNTYVASFTATLGNTSLPMWYQYGDKGAGCSIEFSTKHFSAPIYRLFYLPKDKNDLNSFMDSVSDMLSHTLNGSSFDKHSFFYKFVLSFFAQIAFLVKADCYAHEGEIRAILSCEPQDAATDTELRPGEFFPRTYCETTYQIESVTFGPKVRNIKQLIVGCTSQGLNCKFNQSSLPLQ